MAADDGTSCQVRKRSLDGMWARLTLLHPVSVVFALASAASATRRLEAFARCWCIHPVMLLGCWQPMISSLMTISFHVIDSAPAGPLLERTSLWYHH
eukprot:6174982-Pleurochrysis_carterae.AAC.1